MSGLWRYLFRDNPMQIETLRAIRRFSVTSGRTRAIQRNVARVLVALLCVLYLWFLTTIVLYHEDISEGIFWFEFVVLTLLVPGSLYEAISGERERLTWDSLILTNLSPTRILTGKLLWRLGMAACILLAFLPPLLICHFATRPPLAYSLGNLFWMQTILAAWCVFLAAFTLWVSARTKRSVATLSIVTVFLLASLVLIPTLVSSFGGKAELNTLNRTPVGAAELYSGGGVAVETADDWYFQRGPQFLGNGSWYIAYSPTESPAAYLGSLLIHLNPGYVIGSLDKDTNGVERADFWRDLLICVPLRSDDDALMGRTGEARFGIYTVLPGIYLLFAALCLNGTRKALARLGLPGGATR